ncbi:unnamed protein product [Penicillium olsonii]|nr:unnamed protein product [Penicillium olsonii]CAG7922182.1 unnamed protein product [Penicillium olsonii]
MGDISMHEAASVALDKSENTTLFFKPENMEQLAPMPWIVQKFGGTSLGHDASNIVNQIIIPATAESRVAIVCSAVSRSKKENGTTNRLLRACSELETDGACFSKIIEKIEREHIQAAEQEIRSPGIRETLIQKIRTECACVVRTLNAAYFLGEISPACIGKVVGAGERLSCHYIAAMLQDHGQEATCVDVSEMNLATVVPNSWSDKRFVDTLAAELVSKVCSVPGIPVITGYFGLRPAGALLHFVGRGYTDLCAALVATGLDAAQLQIWKEVDGVCSADPRLVPDAELLSSITTSELRNLTFYGSEVVHCTAVDVAMDRNLTMCVRNVRNPLGTGTLVTPNVEDWTERPMAITKKDYMAIVSVRSQPGVSGLTLQNHISDVLRQWQLTGEHATMSESGISLAIAYPEDIAYGALPSPESRLRYAIEDLKVRFSAVKVSHRMALLCVVCRAVSIDFALVGMLRVLHAMGVPVGMIMHGELRLRGCLPVQFEFALLTLYSNQIRWIQSWVV